MNCRRDVERIIEALVIETGMPAWVILSRKRSERIVIIRQVAYLLARKRDHSYQEIGKAFNRHHTTIMSGVRKVKHQRLLNYSLNALIKRLEANQEER